MKRWLSLLLGWLSMCSLVQAADHQLTIGQGIDVCEACKQNLERMTVHPACERDYSAQLELEPPAWKLFDVAGHIEAMEQVLYFLAAGSGSAGTHCRTKAHSRIWLGESAPGRSRGPIGRRWISIMMESGAGAHAPFSAVPLANRRIYWPGLLGSYRGPHGKPQRH